MKAKTLIKKDPFFAIVFIIIVASFFVRIYKIDFENFSSDEGLTLYNAQKSIAHNIIWSFSEDYVPLYHVMLSLWVSLFGLDEFSVRFLSAFFGALSVYTIYLVSALLFNKKVGIYSAIILAISPFNIYYSQEARPYQLYLFLALSSIYFYLRYIKDSKFIFWYILSTVALLYTHGIALLVVLFQNIYHFFVVRTNIKKWILIQIALFISFIPLLFFVISETLKFASSSFVWVPLPTLLGVLKFLYVFSSGESFTFQNLILGSILSLFFMGLVAFIVYKEIKSMKRIPKDRSSSVFFVLIWLIVPLISLIIYSLLFSSIFVEKYIIFSSAALYILVALSITKMHKHYQMLILLLVILLSLGILFYDSVVVINNSRWTDAVSYIKSGYNAKDSKVILNIEKSKYAFSYYFDQSIFKSEDINQQLAAKGIYGIKNSAELPEEIFNRKDIWLVLHNSQYEDVEGTLFNYFNSNNNLKEYKKFKGVAVYHFSLDNFIKAKPPEDYRAVQYSDERLSSLKNTIKKLIKK